MRRVLALTVALVLIGETPVFAQAHPGSHNKAHTPGQPGHASLDSAEHAAMHALLSGRWTGFVKHQGVATALDVTVAHDSLRNVVLQVHADQAIRAGGVTKVAVSRDTLQWMQAFSGKPCRVAAVVGHGDTDAARTMQGRIVCDDGEMAFTLRKTAE